MDHDCATPTAHPCRLQSRDVELKGHSDSVDSLVWHPHSDSTLATSSSDKTIKLWDTRAGKCSHTFATDGENLNLSWSPDAAYLAAGNKVAWSSCGLCEYLMATCCSKTR